MIDSNKVVREIADKVVAEISDRSAISSEAITAILGKTVESIHQSSQVASELSSASERLNRALENVDKSSRRSQHCAKTAPCQPCASEFEGASS